MSGAARKELESYAGNSSFRKKIHGVVHVEMHCLGEALLHIHRFVV